MVRFLMAALACTGVVHSTAVYGGERGTAEEAVTLARKAVEHIKSVGRVKAFADFGDPNGKFRDRDLYVLVYDMKGVNMAHGVNPKLNGKNLSDIRDADGKLILRAFIDVASTSGKGWIDYKWPNPISQTLESKSTYVEKFEDIVVGVGIYK